MFNSPIEEIKSKLDVVEILQGYIKLQKAGVNFKALCPFHHEKTPSFVISPAKQIWHCFGCQKGGDIFRFVMEIEGVEFGDALRTLAQRAGVVLKKEDPQLQTERKKLYEICELATKFFIKQLEANKKVMDYLLSRGLTKKSIEEFRIGFAPEGLLQFLLGRGYSNQDAEKAGLAVNGLDRFRNRIMFPIFDINGQVIGFGGRIFIMPSEILAKAVAKYINTPNTLIYDKSQVLYGLDKGKLVIRKKDQCILVEGYMDAIMVYQIGFQNVVATSGTALTPQQLKILKRYTHNILSAFDADLAGKNATERGIDLALQQGFDIQVLSLSDAKDPADYIKEKPNDFAKQVASAKSIMEFYFSQAIPEKKDLTAKDKKIISASLLPHLKKLSNKIEQAHWVEKLSQYLEVPSDSIQKEMGKVQLRPSNESGFRSLEAPENLKAEPINRKQLLAERFLVILFKHPQIAEGFSAFGGPAAGWKISFPHLVLRSEFEEITDPLREIKYCLQEIKSHSLKEELQKINLAIKKDEIQKKGETENLMNQFRQLTQELSQLLKI